MAKIKNIITNKYAIISTVVLLLGFVLSFFASKLLFDYNKAQQRLWIERHVESQSEQLQISITSALNSLSSISAFFRVQENIDQDRFLKFVKSDAAIKTGIVALAWVPRITHAQRQQFELSLNKHLRGYRSITEMNGHGLLVPAQVRDEYFPVQHLFSTFDTELFTGINLASQFNTRKGIISAIKTGRLLVSQGKRSSFNTFKQTTFQAYFPVFDLENNNVPNGTEKNNLIGFAVGLFDIEKIIQNTFQKGDVNLALFDVDAVQNNQLLYKSKTDYIDQLKLNKIHDLSALEIPYWTRYFDIGDQRWLGVFILEGTEGKYTKSWLPYLGLFTGLLITSLLAIYLFMVLLRGQQIHSLKNKLIGSEQLITNQESALQAQNKLTQKLETESYEKTRFLHALGHDLRQPLSTLGLYLAQFQLKDEKNKSILEKSRLTLSSLNNMFESLLEMTRLDAGIIQPEKTEVNINTLFQNLHKEFELPIKNKALTFKLHSNNQIVYTDPVLLERVLRNLLANAIKFTDKGKILLAARTKNKDVIIYIMDTGRGIEKTKISEIFKPYTRGDELSNETNMTQGLGLGLSIVSHISKLLDHDLSISSSTDKGTCFKIILPHIK